MAYVTTEELKRMSRMLMDHAKMIASNYCFVNKHDEPKDVEEVTGKLLKFFGQKITEVELEKKDKMNCHDAVRYLQATGMSDEQILTIWKAFSTKDSSI